MSQDLILNLPGKVTRVGWIPPKSMTLEEWLEFGRALDHVEGAVQWWRGDWWAFGIARKYGEGREIAEQAGVDYGTIRNYASISIAFESSRRRDNLTFSHHQEVASLSLRAQDKWLDRAEKEVWSVMQLRSNVKQAAAVARTKAVELDAAKLGKFVVLYVDPPWRYENPPMGGGNRSIENHYPTMDLAEIISLGEQVREVAHENAVLFMWATSPKLSECMEVLKAWEFNYRTDMVWVKDKIGMGYHCREQHECLLIAKQGELPPPAPENRPSSVVHAPRTEHSAKPLVFYEIIDKMYPKVRKVELFARADPGRPMWSVWGNQSHAKEAAE